MRKSASSALLDDLLPSQDDRLAVADLPSDLDRLKTAQTNPLTMGNVKLLIAELGEKAVHSPEQIRNLVTNRLIVESDHINPQVRIKALELLGKITDVGLFSERSEVLVKHQSTSDLEARLRQKLDALRQMVPKEDISDAIIVTEPEKPSFVPKPTLKLLGNDADPLKLRSIEAVTGA